MGKNITATCFSLVQACFNAVTGQTLTCKTPKTPCLHRKEVAFVFFVFFLPLASLCSSLLRFKSTRTLFSLNARCRLQFALSEVSFFQRYFVLYEMYETQGLTTWMVQKHNFMYIYIFHHVTSSHSTWSRKPHTSDKLIFPFTLVVSKRDTHFPILWVRGVWEWYQYD